MRSHVTIMLSDNSKMTKAWKTDENDQCLQKIDRRRSKTVMKMVSDLAMMNLKNTMYLSGQIKQEICLSMIYQENRP